MLGAPAGLRHRNGQSRTPTAERISGGRGEIKGRLLFPEGEKATLTSWDCSPTGTRGSPKIWQQRRTRTPFSAGIGSSSRTSLTDRDFADEQVDRGDARYERRPMCLSQRCTDMVW